MEDLIQAAREVDAFFTSDDRPNEAERASGIVVFRFDGNRVSDEAQDALLNLHDRLNDLDNATR